jgi:hypothetical protein
MSALNVAIAGAALAAMAASVSAAAALVVRGRKLSSLSDPVTCNPSASGARVRFLT